MSNKSDRDNRSNQLNPNNPAYASSRAGHSCDDEDDDWDPVPAVSRDLYQLPPTIHVSGKYGVGMVSSQGQARFVTFELEASDSSGLYGDAHASLQAQIEDYFERFAAHVYGLFCAHLKARPVLYIEFDGTAGRLPWHVPLNLSQPEIMRTFVRSESMRMNGVLAPETAIELLCERLQGPAEDWGKFEALRRNTSDLTFVYAQRCNAEILKCA